MSALAWLELGLVVLLGTAGQLALKYALRPHAGRRPASQLLISPPMLLWLLCYVASLVLWLLALRSVPLSQAYPILGLQFALIPFAASRMMREHVTPAQWLGVVLIVMGVALVGQH